MIQVKWIQGIKTTKDSRYSVKSYFLTNWGTISQNERREYSGSASFTGWNHDVQSGQGEGMGGSNMVNRTSFVVFCLLDYVDFHLGKSIRSQALENKAPFMKMFEGLTVEGNYLWSSDLDSKS